MSLPIVDEEDDDIDVDESSRPVAVQRPPKSKPMAERLAVVSAGEEECYWCGRAFSKNKMKRITMAGLPAYKCERC